MFVIIDRHTGQQVGKPCSTKAGARRAADRLDLAYGAYRYSVKSLEV